MRSEAKPTYVEFTLQEESSEFLDMYMDQLDLPKPKWGYHITSVYSRNPIDYKPLDLPEVAYLGFFDGIMFLKGEGDLGLCLTLSVNCNAVWVSHQSSIDLGASHDYKNFLPHITLAYNLQVEHLIEKRLEVPTQGFRVQAETILELDDNWRPIYV